MPTLEIVNIGGKVFGTMAITNLVSKAQSKKFETGKLQNFISGSAKLP